MVSVQVGIVVDEDLVQEARKWEDEYHEHQCLRGKKRRAAEGVEPVIEEHLQAQEQTLLVNLEGEVVHSFHLHLAQTEQLLDLRQFGYYDVSSVDLRGELLGAPALVQDFHADVGFLHHQRVIVAITDRQDRRRQQLVLLDQRAQELLLLRSQVVPDDRLAKRSQELEMRKQLLIRLDDLQALAVDGEHELIDLVQHVALEKGCRGPDHLALPLLLQLLLLVLDQLQDVIDLREYFCFVPMLDSDESGLREVGELLRARQRTGLLVPAQHPEVDVARLDVADELD